MFSTFISTSFRRATMLMNSSSNKVRAVRSISNYSTQSSVTTKEVSPHIGFYKTFSRPIAKVLLMATFTYQLAYWAWVKLEKDEVQIEREAEISKLENKLQDVVKAAAKKA